MSAHMISDYAPLGAIISWSDGAPRPPEHHVKEVYDWKQNNGESRLVSKRAMGAIGPIVSTGYFTLRQSDPSGLADRGWDRTFDTRSGFLFKILNYPPAGSFRILRSVGAAIELLHVATSRDHAETWVRNLGFGEMAIEEVSADQIAADVVEGRAVA